MCASGAYSALIRGGRQIDRGGEMAYVGPMTTAGKDRIMIYGPKEDGTYIVEFRTAAGDATAISIPRTEAAIIRHFQERMPYGLFVPPLRGKRGTPLPKK
jgi:hypothetical protein